MEYHYCPQCGSKLIKKEAGDDGLVPYCQSCKQFWFDGFASCIICLVVNEENEIAMLKQSYMPSEYWSYVAGFIQPGENAETCAIREVKEEIGQDVERLEYAGTYWFEKREQLMHGFIGYVKKKDLKLSSEISQARWVKRDQAMKRMHPESSGSCQIPIFKRYLQLENKEKA